MKNRIIFVSGGSRSGKSSYAVQTALAINGKTAFIATCQALDKEMNKRIKMHKKERPSAFKTLEEPLYVSKLLRKVSGQFDILIIDCVTLLVSNFMMNGFSENMIYDEFDKIIKTLKKHRGHSIIVSNEVGLGIVPENELARKFRDIAGRVNQKIAKSSDEFYFMFSGIPAKIK